MSFNFYFNIGLIFLLTGIATSIYFTLILKKPMLGKYWGALVVAVIGSFLGGAVEYFFSGIIDRLSHLLNGSVNIFPPIITSLLLLWVFSKVSDRT